MLELIDEIGKHHVKVLRHIAECCAREDGSGWTYVIGSNDPDFAANVFPRGDMPPGYECCVTSHEVVDTLMQLGMIVEEGKMLLRGTQKKVPPPNHQIRGYRVRMGERGKEFLSRWLLSHTLSVFTARGNKWFAFGLAVVGVVGWQTIWWVLQWLAGLVRLLA